MAEPSVVLWDIGGVLLSDGWDRASREAGAREFGYDLELFERRHEAAAPRLERGEIDLNGYLDETLPAPNDPRSALRTFILAQSRAHPETLALARALAAGGRYTMAALNNEGRDLNDHRIRTFGLDSFLSAFFSSCYTGMMKPDPRLYRLAVDVLHRPAASCVFIDDRPENLEPARALGMSTIHYQSSEQLAAELAARGVRT